MTLKADDLAPAVEKLASGKKADGIALIANVLGTAAFGPIVGALGSGSVSLIAELIANSATKRLTDEAKRLDAEDERAGTIADRVRRSLERLQTNHVEELRLLSAGVRADELAEHSPTSRMRSPICATCTCCRADRSTN